MATRPPDAFDDPSDKWTRAALLLTWLLTAPFFLGVAVLHGPVAIVGVTGVLAVAILGSIMD